MFRGQDHSGGRPAQSFHGELSVHHRDHHRAGVAWNGAVDDEKISVMDSRALHRSSACANEECRSRVRDEFFIEIERPLDVVIGRRGKTGFDPTGEQWSGDGWCPGFGFRAILHGRKTLTKYEQKASLSALRCSGDLGRGAPSERT